MHVQLGVLSRWLVASGESVKWQRTFSLAGQVHLHRGGLLAPSSPGIDLDDGLAVAMPRRGRAALDLCTQQKDWR